MVPRLCFVIADIYSGLVWHLPLRTMMLAGLGLILLIAGIGNTHSSGTSPHRDTMRARTVGGVALMVTRTMPPHTRRGYTDTAVEAHQHATLVKEGPESVLQRIGCPTGGRKQFEPRGFPGGRDLRLDLIELAAAQRGHWEQLCPCPDYAFEDPADGPR